MAAPESKAVKKVNRTETKTPAKPAHPPKSDSDPAGVAGLQQSVGNRAVQRLLAQRREAEPAGDNPKVKPALEAKIDEKRGHGQSIDPDTQAKMSQAFGRDFSGVQIHTDSDSHHLNRALEARAFTTGHDIFFRQGEYNPNTAGSQELLAHELTHVAQQEDGEVDFGGDGMRVNEPDDVYEKEADSIAKRAASNKGEPSASAGGASGPDGGSVQREEYVMAKSVQRDDMEDELAMKPVQREGIEEEELMAKPVQREEMEDELAMKPVQREGLEEEELMTKPVQRDDMEDELAMKPVQREGIEEEELMAKPVQREEMEDELAMKPVQREEEVEEELLQKPVQRQTSTPGAAGGRI